MSCAANHMRKSKRSTREIKVIDTGRRMTERKKTERTKPYRDKIFRGTKCIGRHNISVDTRYQQIKSICGHYYVPSQSVSALFCRRYTFFWADMFCPDTFSFVLAIFQNRNMQYLPYVKIGTVLDLPHFKRAMWTAGRTPLCAGPPLTPRYKVQRPTIKCQ